MKETNIKKRETLYSGFFVVERLMMQLNGHKEEVERVIVKQKSGVAVVLYCEDEDFVVLVKQFRVPVLTKNDHPYIIEIPAGVIDDDEETDEGVCREVKEETGYVIKSPQKIMSVYTSPGISDEKLRLYYAPIKREDRKHEGGGLEEEHEDIEIMEVPLKRCMEMIENGEIQDAKSVICLQWLWINRQKK